MKTLLFWLLFAGVVALVVWLVRLNRQLTEKRNQRFRTAAHDRGWQFMPNPQYSAIVSRPGATRTEEDDTAFTVEGAVEGQAGSLPWRMWYDTAHRFDIPPDDRSSMPFAVWACEAVGARELRLLILPRWQYRVESSRVFGAIASAANAFLAAITGVDDPDTRQRFFAHARELKGANPALHDAFVVLAASDAPGDWFDPELEALLLQWPRQAVTNKLELTASLGAAGLRMVFQRPIADAWPFWEQFGRLGEGLCLRLVRSKVAAVTAA